MRKLAIIGSSDLGKLIAHHANDSDWEVVGFFDNLKPVGSQIDPYGTVLGDVDQIESSYRKKLFDFIMVGVGYTQFVFRKAIFERFKGVIPFANLIHRSSFVDPTVFLGEGVFILPGCVLDMGVRIEDNVLINSGSVIAHHSTIGCHSFVAPGVTIAGKVRISECCFIGVGSTVQDSLHITSKSLVGGGSLITEDIIEPGTYFGRPAKRIKDNIYFKN